MTGELREYTDSDFDTAARHWEDIGWIDGSERERKRLRTSWGVGEVFVGDVDGSAEALAHWVPGSVRYEGADVGLAAITAVTTGQTARRHHFASRLTSRCLARGAEAGHGLAMLGIFDQGFYDRLGFGTGSYDHRFRFDPAQLMVPALTRSPVRLTIEDAAEIHALMVRRHRDHGGVVLDGPAIVEAEMSYVEKALGLGFRDGERLTHFVFLDTKDETGAYDVTMYGYEEPGQYIELLSLLKSLGDQVRSVRTIEPAHVQMQDWLHRPFRDRGRTAGSRHAVGNEASAWWQARMLDVVACMSRSCWLGPPTSFDLVVMDPVAEFLDGAWQGVAGEHHVIVDERFEIEPGARGGVPTLTCSVNALTRWWLGVLPASSLSLLPGFDGPPDLIAALDHGYRVPLPSVSWNF